MANVAVKFYSMSAQAYGNATKDNGALYFVNNGELYKGTQRFGANKVFTVPANTTITGETDEEKLNSALTAAGVAAENANAIGGDILTGYGAAKVFNGSTWIDLGADTSSIIAQISDSTSTSTANGITVSVTTSDGYVTGVSVGATEITGVSLVSATTGSFTDLVVANTATFSATSVEADSLTVNGSTIEEIAGAQISASTLAGSIADGAGLSLVREGQVVNYVESYVGAQLQSFGNAMHFIGVATALSYPTSAQAGDIVVIGDISASDAFLGFDSNGDFTNNSGEIVESVLQGQEYVYDGSKWEKIGDENVPSGGTGTSSVNGVEVTVVTAQATAAPTVTLTGVGDAAAKSVATTLDASGANLPTEAAVASYVSSAISAAELVWLDENNSPITT